MRLLLLVALSALLPTAAYCQQADPPPSKTAADRKLLDQQAIEAKEAATSGTQNFGGIDFGIGISMTYDLGKNERVRDATIVDGIVRVTHAENVRARVVLESHYFFTPTLSAARREEADSYCADVKHDPVQYRNCRSSLKDFGIGPFVALQPGSDKVIDAIGAGVMVGMRRGTDRASSLNFGVGIFYDVDTQILGNGFKDDQPPPGNEVEVRFRRQSQSGILFLSSFSF